jgi:signal transduction histidine kinase
MGTLHAGPTCRMMTQISNMPPARIKLASLGLLLLVGITPHLSGQETNRPAPLLLTNVAQVRQLTSAQAATAFPVKLRGVVLAESDPRERAVILDDTTGGLYLLATANIFAPFRRGDLLEVEGVSDPGGFAPIVIASAARKLGTTNLPPPRAVTYHQLLTGALDAQWVELTGVVRRYIPPEPNADIWRILVASDGGVVSIRGALPHDPNLQADAEVRVQAICLYQFNQKRQVLTPILQLTASSSVQVLKPAPANPFAAPVRAANSLLQFSPDVPAGHRIHVRGVVTHAQSGTLVWIRDASAGLRIQTRQKDELKAGDEVDVLGFPAYGSFSPILEEAIFRKAGTSPPPLALLITNASAAFDHEDDLIQMDAWLSDVQPIMEGIAFTFHFDDTVFKATLKLPPNRDGTPWLPGSRIRVTGICSLIHEDIRPMMGVWQPQSFQLLIRSPADLVVLSAPPWWTPQRIIYALGFVCVMLLIASGVGMALSRRRLNEQAHRRQMAETEFSAILSERNRVAREIHDTLAQGLAATSVHLRLAKKQNAGDPESWHHHLDVAQQLVRDSLEEARNSIWNMRSQVLETGDLPGALEGILKQMADGTELQTAFAVTGRPRRFAPVIENNLLRVGQEAITNAARHARAQHLKVTLDFGGKQFRLTVRDDGAGFDPAHPPSSPGGLGLVGMRERASELKGELHLRSAPGQGTEIILTVPLSGE